MTTTPESARHAPDLVSPHETERPDPDRAAEIYQAAARIFCDQGFHATSINEIADAVQLTKAGLYYYIKGKQDLLYRIMDFAMGALEREVIAVAAEAATPEQRLRGIVTRHAELVTEAGSAPFSLLVNELQGLGAEQRADMVSRQRRYVELVRDTLDALRDEGRLNDIDSTTAAFSLLGMILWTSRWFRPGGRLSAEEVVRQITTIALSGVLNGRSKTA